MMPSLAARTSLIEHLRACGVQAVFHYVPLHLSPMGRKFGGKEGDCPVTEERAERLVRLPMFHELSADDQGRVIDAVTSWAGTSAAAGGGSHQKPARAEAAPSALP